MVRGLLSSCGAQASLQLWDAGSRARGLCSLQHTGSLVEVRGLSWPTACGILVPQPGIKPMSPALEGGFLTTGPPGKSLTTIFFKRILMERLVLNIRKDVFSSETDGKGI